MILMVILTPIAVFALVMALARLEAALLPGEREAPDPGPHAPPQ